MDEIVRLASILHEKIENFGTTNYLSLSEYDKVELNALFNLLETFLKK